MNKSSYAKENKYSIFIFRDKATIDPKKEKDHSYTFTYFTDNTNYTN